MSSQRVFFLLWSPGTVQLCALCNNRVEVRCQLNEPSATMDRRVWLKMGKVDNLVTLQLQRADGKFHYLNSTDDGFTFSDLACPGACTSQQTQLHSDGSITAIEGASLHAFLRKDARWTIYQLPPHFIGTGTAIDRQGTIYVAGRTPNTPSSRPQIQVIRAGILSSTPVCLSAWDRLSIGWHCAEEPDWFVAAETGRIVLATDWYTGIDSWTAAAVASKTLFLIEDNAKWHKLVAQGTAFLIRQGMSEELLMFSSTAEVMRTLNGGRNWERRALAPILALNMGLPPERVPTITAIACKQQMWLAAVTWYEPGQVESRMVESQLLISQDAGASFDRLTRYASSLLEIRDVAPCEGEKGTA